MCGVMYIWRCAVCVVCFRETKTMRFVRCVVDEPEIWTNQLALTFSPHTNNNNNNNSNNFSAIQFKYKLVSSVMLWCTGDRAVLSVHEYYFHAVYAHVVYLAGSRISIFHSNSIFSGHRSASANSSGMSVRECVCVYGFANKWAHNFIRVFSCIHNK